MQTRRRGGGEGGRRRRCPPAPSPVICGHRRAGLRPGLAAGSPPGFPGSFRPRAASAPRPFLPPPSFGGPPGSRPPPPPPRGGGTRPACWELAAPPRRSRSRVRVRAWVGGRRGCQSPRAGGGPWTACSARGVSWGEGCLLPPYPGAAGGGSASPRPFCCLGKERCLPALSMTVRTCSRWPDPLGSRRKRPGIYFSRPLKRSRCCGELY